MKSNTRGFLFLVTRTHAQPTWRSTASLNVHILVQVFGHFGSGLNFLHFIPKPF